MKTNYLCLSRSEAYAILRALRSNENKDDKQIQIQNELENYFKSVKVNIN